MIGSIVYLYVLSYFIFLTYENFYFSNWLYGKLGSILLIIVKNSIKIDATIVILMQKKLSKKNYLIFKCFCMSIDHEKNLFLNI